MLVIINFSDGKKERPPEHAIMFLPQLSSNMTLSRSWEVFFMEVVELLELLIFLIDRKFVSVQNKEELIFLTNRYL